MIQATISGSDTITLNEKVMTGVKFDMITPDDSNSRSTDQYTQLTLTGKIIPSVASAATEATVGLDKWAAVTDDKADAYRSVDVKVIESGVTVREYKLTKAFVVNYNTAHSDDAGNGTFVLQVRQKKDLNKDVTVSGGFAS